MHTLMRTFLIGIGSVGIEAQAYTIEEFSLDRAGLRRAVFCSYVYMGF